MATEFSVNGITFPLSDGVSGQALLTDGTGVLYFGDVASDVPIDIGDTLTGPPGSNASVINVGNSSNIILEFTIPEGDKGDKGTVQIGTVTTGAAGSSASVVDIGTPDNAILDFTIPRGDTGATGPQGAAATIAVGSTSTGLPGTNASVTNSGTSGAAIFDFVIPRGDKGDQGDPGLAATIGIGTVSTGLPGTNVDITNSGTATAATFNFTIPRGDTGATGPQGPQGDAATITVGTVTTGAPGSSVIVTNSGTTGAAIFDFTIPRGDTGDGIPVGGTTGQLLSKLSATDYDYTWVDPYTSTSFANDLAAANTNSLSEGTTNLYFTNQRAIDAVAGVGYLTSETDTLQTVTARGNTATTSITTRGYIGSDSSNVAKYEMVYNETTQSIDFNFL